ncbi:MAG: hypothetical protein II820_02215 [Ruminiclostridium sp.]|nr:hypothetical protein [Ruminiclostridium sp.]
MDRFSEQLVTKQSTGKDMFLRGLLLAAAMLLVAVFVFFLGGFGLWILVAAFSAAVVWGLVWLIQGTFVEYEYIVTNDDLDIDKIIGKRKRKRLITVSLRSVKELAEYTPDKEISADVSVIAHDESGIGMYYVISESEKYGDLAVIFNPDKRTLYNMIGGFSPAVRSKYNELYEKVTPADAVQNDSEEQ